MPGGRSQDGRRCWLRPHGHRHGIEAAGSRQGGTLLILRVARWHGMMRLRWCRAAHVRRLCTQQHDDAPRLQDVYEELAAAAKPEPKPAPKAPPPKRIQAVRGFKARFPVEVEHLRHIEQTLIRVCSRYGFREISFSTLLFRCAVSYSAVCFLNLSQSTFEFRLSSIERCSSAPCRTWSRPKSSSHFLYTFTVLALHCRVLS